ncbi:hypothetical protein [Noviherbaspirillum denitrificans]|uniref:Uncharacterized protein n=1 Tax=Noviherbaspirillum denitrificans TaxID=1968433 RepID=A0A254TAR5_9BURK|nr:hypothetical protein [Noviherbaspirillum denitrificans]OWW18362.1 hypothetical protein AYR66_01200 [Noviherbaspirillum denitrificans]
MKKENACRITVINLEALRKVYVWSAQLVVALEGDMENMRIGDLVVAVRGCRIVSVGRVTDFLLGPVGRMHLGCPCPRQIRIDLMHLDSTLRISPRQRDAIREAAAAYGFHFEKMRSALALPTEYANSLDSVLWKIKRAYSEIKERCDNAMRIRSIKIMNRTDIDAARKIELCLALEAEGALAQFVVDRDLARFISDAPESLILVATLIKPWEVCSDDELLDPENYLLLDMQHADLFSAGLITFSSSGKQIDDPAMDEDFCGWSDNSFCIAKPSKEQKRYLAFHRRCIFKQWRTYLPISPIRRKFVIESEAQDL